MSMTNRSSTDSAITNQPVKRMSVMQHLHAQPHAFDFIQAIRLLCIMGGNPDLSLTLTPDPMPHGAPTAVTAIEKVSDQYRLTLGLEALSGCQGIIPDYLYAEMLHRLHQDDHALQQFLDVFNQRYYELRASVERSASLMLRDEKEKLSQAFQKLNQQNALGCLFALPGSQQGATHPSMLRYGLTFANKSRSLSGLKRLLCDYFGLDIRPQVVASAVYRIRPQDQTRIGLQQGQNHQLGCGVVLGKQGTQSYQALEICITPRSRDEYLNLLNNAPFARAMSQLVTTYLRESLQTKLYLDVKRAYIDTPILSSGKSSIRLGEANCLAPERRATQYRKILLQS